MSPDPCSDFSSSSFDPSDHSPPPIAPNSLAAAADRVPQPPPYFPSSLPPSQVQASQTPPQPVPERSSETSAPPSTLRVPRLYPDLLGSPPHTWSQTTLKQETSPHDPLPSPAPFMGSSWSRRHVQVYVPFSLTSVSHIEKHLDSFSSDTDSYLKGFKYLTQSYDLTWHEYVDDTFVRSSPRREGMRQASQAHADETHRTDPQLSPEMIPTGIISRETWVSESIIII